MSLKHLKNIDYVVQNAEHVHIDEQKAIEFGKNIKMKNTGYWTSYSVADFSDLSKEDYLKVLFLFNATSFSYWKEEPWIVNYKNNTSIRGSWSNFLAIRRAIDEGIPILDFHYQTAASNKEFEHIWRAKEKIPMLKIRADFVRNNAQKILESYKGNLHNLLEESNYDVVNLTNILTKNFKSFKHTSTYKGKEITFNKRAQLFAADTHYLITPMNRIEELSGCADYKIPIPLKFHKIFQFSKELESKIKNKELITEQAIIDEILACELQAFELIAGNKYQAMDVSNHLWVYWQALPKKEQNYLRFRSTGC